MEIIIIIHQLKQPLAPDYAKTLEHQIMFSSAGGILFGARLRTHLKLYVYTDLVAGSFSRKCSVYQVLSKVIDAGCFLRKLLLFVVPPSQFKSLKIKFCHNFSKDRQILLIMSGGLCCHPALRSSQQRKVGRSVPCPHKQQPGGRQVRSDLHVLRSLLSIASEPREKWKRNNY